MRSCWVMLRRAIAKHSCNPPVKRSCVNAAVDLTDYSPWPPMSDYRKWVLRKYASGKSSAKDTCVSCHHLGNSASEYSDAVL